ncbi:hypothetical protein QUF90_06385 [Desulfococcaceae bacterium HSG9]|nr:hypothetical protein [Desulfococcaceae bacterium HSG9]
MPIPFILGGIAIGAAIVGAKKGVDAKSDFSLAKRKGEKAQDKFKKAQKKVNKEREVLNDHFKEFARYKIDIFQIEIKSLIDVIKKFKDSKSTASIEQNFSEEEVKQISKNIDHSVNIVSSSLSSASAGALTAFGAYGTAGVLATASTGTAISSLSGVAATNATLAWFGGGSLAAGGFGMAGGTLVLGGLVAGPALAVMGFMAAASADKAYTDACKYESKVDEEIEKIKVAIEIMHQIKERIEELKYVIGQLRNKFNENFTDDNKDKHFDTMLAIGKSLKRSLEISVLDKDGDLKINENIKSEIIELEV